MANIQNRDLFQGTSSEAGQRILGSDIRTSRLDVETTVSAYATDSLLSLKEQLAKTNFKGTVSTTINTIIAGIINKIFPKLPITSPSNSSLPFKEAPQSIIV